MELKLLHLLVDVLMHVMPQNKLMLEDAKLVKTIASNATALNVLDAKIVSSLIQTCYVRPDAPVLLFCQNHTLLVT
jgi:hypothetical protein